MSKKMPKPAFFSRLKGTKMLKTGSGRRAEQLIDQTGPAGIDRWEGMPERRLEKQRYFCWMKTTSTGD